MSTRSNTPTRRRPLRRWLAIALAAIAGAPATAQASSIAFVKDGNVWLSRPDGGGQVQVTRDGGYESPTQADDGTIVALRPNGKTDGLFYRLRQNGELLNPPVRSTTFGIPPTSGAEVFGPFDPQVSADGTRIAYWWAMVLHRFDVGCGCTRDTVLVDGGYTYADRYVDLTGPGDLLSDYDHPAWIGAGTGATLVFGASFESENVAVALPGQPDETAIQGWFTDPDARLARGALSRTGDRLAAVTEAFDPDTATIRLYSVSAPPPTSPGAPRVAPAFRCAITQDPPVALSNVSWSPDGSALAYQATDGVRVLQVGNLAAGCPTTSTLIAPGGRFPSWGPADVNPGPPAASTPPPTTPTPPPPSPTPPAGSPATPDTTAPTIRGLALGEGSMRAGRSAVLRFTLSEGATVTLRVERLRKGRALRLPGALHARGVSGANRLRFAGRLGGHRLGPGRYRLVASARDAAGNGSKSVRVTFTVRR